MMINFQAILDFWFEQLTAEQWFRASAETDQKIQAFSALHSQACAGELEAWRDQPLGRLAEIIVLDQFSRNLWRGSPQGFAQDGLALILSQEAIRAQADKGMETQQRLFCYMPFMHSESFAIHQQGIKLFQSLDFAPSLKSAQEHYDIIEKFGRYPHRNAVLGRESTPQELEFLKTHQGF